MLCLHCRVLTRRCLAHVLDLANAYMESVIYKCMLRASEGCVRGCAAEEPWLAGLPCWVPTIVGCAAGCLALGRCPAWAVGQ